MDNTNTCENESTRAWIGSKAPLTLTETFTRAEYSSYISTIAKSSTNNFDLPHIIKCNAPEKNISPEIDLSSVDFMHTLIIWICLCSCCIASFCGCDCTFRLKCYREDRYFKQQASAGMIQGFAGLSGLLLNLGAFTGHIDDLTELEIYKDELRDLNIIFLLLMILQVVFCIIDLVLICL